MYLYFTIINLFLCFSRKKKSVFFSSNAILVPMSALEMWATSWSKRKISNGLCLNLKDFENYKVEDYKIFFLSLDTYSVFLENYFCFTNSI